MKKSTGQNLYTKVLWDLKVGLSPSKKCYFVYFNESPLKMMKNAFIFTLKNLFILKMFKVLSCLFGHVQKWLDQRKIRLISKFMMSQLGQQLQYKYIAQYLTK